MAECRIGNSVPERMSRVISSSSANVQLSLSGPRLAEYVRGRPLESRLRTKVLGSDSCGSGSGLDAGSGSELESGLGSGLGGRGRGRGRGCGGVGGSGSE